MENNLGNKIAMAKNLKYYVDQKGMTPANLADAMGFPRTTVYDWFNANTYPRIDRIEMMANYFGINKSDLIEPKNIPRSDNTISVPLIGQIAAGSPILAEENIEDYFNLDSRIKADFCLRVKGDSMIDEGIYPNDIVFIKKQEDIDNGEIGAVVIDGEATLKRVHKENGSLILQPANKNYKPMFFTSGDVRIAGKLVAVLNIRD